MKDKVKLKKDNKFQSVRIRLFLTLSISIAIIILLLVFTNSIVLKSFYIYTKILTVKDSYNEINELYNTESDVSSDDISRIAVKNNFEILVETSDNVVEFSTSQSYVDDMNRNKSITHLPENDKNGKKLIYANDSISINVVSSNGLNCILLSGKLDNGYQIYIQIPIAAIDESVKISNNLLLIMGTIIIIISAIIASFISKKFTKPILQLNNIANKMANLDFSEKYIANDSDDEINELGISINTMSDKLEGTIKQLRSNNNQLEKDIEEKSKIDDMRKQFISDVSHELKTPIALIQGYAEGLVENVSNTEESRKYYAEVILDESNKMDKLVKQLLELMKIEYGKRDFNDEKFDICELIKEVIRKCEVMVKEKGANIEFNYKEPIYVYADEFYIEQAFTNYITNAIKHVKNVNGENKIVIKAKIMKLTNKVRIYVFNTGDTLSEENLDKIWGRFYKVDESRNRSDGGTGIGLSLVKAIISSYGNNYGVDNKENGVEFYFDINLMK